MLDRYSGVSGLVGSQGRSQSALRTRASRQTLASRTRTGRSPIGASSSAGSMIVTGHPRIRPTWRHHSLCSEAGRYGHPDPGVDEK